MADAQTLEDRSPGLFKGVERAQQEPEGQCNSLAQRNDMVLPQQRAEPFRARPPRSTAPEGAARAATPRVTNGEARDRGCRGVGNTGHPARPRADTGEPQRAAGAISHTPPPAFACSPH